MSTTDPTRPVRSTPVAVTVDWTRCDAHGMCAALSPDVFGLDPWGFPVLRPGAHDPADVRRAVGCCPALALRETRAESGTAAR